MVGVCIYTEEKPERCKIRKPSGMTPGRWVINSALYCDKEAISVTSERLSQAGMEKHSSALYRS